ncbi:MAG: peptide chain release factor N(5)-glutamine methyltransferase [Gammaproteobacteria bacterium]|jgi:release factor glutamine methyltransferase|nr:peptide chain release factor N(5)-glutamine methyltransferase [Gammaproteobacteria bacterium]
MSKQTLSTALARATELLASLGADARDEASWLVLRCLAIGRAALASEPERPVNDADWQRLESWAVRRAAGEPLAYLTGEREFWSLPLQVTPAVLVPRPETELLVERALACGDALQSQRTHPLRVLDLGTGSGAIALALAHERGTWEVTAIDRSSAALEIARANAARLDLGRVRFLLGDWFAPLVAERFDVIASNPPYVAADDPVLQGDSLRHEPYAALTPGADALAALRCIVEAAPVYLAPLGTLLLEHGHDQGPAVRALLVQRGFTHVVSHPDLAGRERVTRGSLPGDL